MLRRLLVLVLIAASAAGCSEAFDPFVEMDEDFALFGFFDARRDTQFVRVQPLTDRDAVPVLGDVTLTSTNLGTGATQAWQDSLVTLDDGALGLLFFAAFRPDLGTVYRLEVEGADGAFQRVDVAVPAEPVLDIAQPTSLSGIILQRLNVASPTLPTGVQVVYTVRLVGGPTQEVAVDYDARIDSQGEGYDVVVRLSHDVFRVRFELGVGSMGQVELLGLRLRYEIVDPERVVVADGLGVVGVAAAFESAWTLAEPFAEALGYIDRQGEGTSGGG